MRDRRNLSSRQKTSLARNSDTRMDPYDRGAHDLARAASHNRHLCFIVANIRAAWRNFNYLMSGAQISARRVLKRKFMGGISRFAMDFALRVLRAVYVSRHGIFRTALRKILRRALLDFDFRVLAEILSPKQNRRNFIKSFIDEILQSSRTCK
jgi:hypothetical protein